MREMDPACLKSVDFTFYVSNFLRHSKWERKGHE